MPTPSATGERSPLGMLHTLRAGWLRHWRLGLMTSLMLAAPGLASTAQFKQAPGVPEKDGEPVVILGLIHANTLLFIALGVFGVFWFLFGGGRKAKIGRRGQ